MQEYLRAELCELAKYPPVEVWLARVRARKALDPKEIPIDVILAARDADRR